MNFRAAIREAIIANAPIVALLGIYVAGANTPAVFSPVKPADYAHGVKPAILIRLPTDLEDFSPFQGTGADILITLAIYAMYGENDTDADGVELVALMLRDLFKNQAFTGSDGLTYQAVVSGPIAAPIDNIQMVGMALQLRLKVGG